MMGDTVNSAREIEATEFRKRERGTRWAPWVIGAPLVCIGVLGWMLFVNNRPPNIAVPGHAIPKDNGYDYFVRAGEMARNLQNRPPSMFANPPPNRAERFALCKACALEAGPVLAELRKGLQRPYMHPPVRSFDRAGWRSMSWLRELSRTCMAIATYHEMRDAPADAADVLLTVMEMGLTLPRGGGVLTMYAGTGCEAMAAGTLDRILPNLSAADLARVARRLDEIAAKRTPLPDLLREESRIVAAGWTKEIARLRDVEDLYDQAVALAGVRPGQLATPEQGWEVASYMLGDKKEMIQSSRRYLERAAAEAERPYTDKATVSLPDDLLGRTLGPFTFARRVYVSRLAVMTVLRTKVALLRYRAALGKYPESLTALIPAYLPDPCIDPFAGETEALLRYRRKGAEYVLYSVGPDMKDDGGKPATWFGGPSGDVVAGNLQRPRRRPPPSQGTSQGTRS